MKDVKIDPPEIVYPALRDNQWVRGKYVCMSLADWTQFADALAEAFPDAIYSRGLSLAETTGPEQPELRIERHLCHARETDPDHPDGVGLPGSMTMHFDPAAEFEVRKIVNWHFGAKRTAWPKIYFRLQPHARPADALSPEHRDEGQIQIYIEPHNKGHARFMRQIFRLLAQFTSSEKLPLVRYPHYEFVQMGNPRFSLCCGHDALRWAREDPKRLLAYNLSPLSERTPDFLGWGFRPRDEG